MSFCFQNLLAPDGRLFDHIDTMADFDANYRAPDSKQTLLHLVSPRRHAV